MPVIVVGTGAVYDEAVHADLLACEHLAGGAISFLTTDRLVHVDLVVPPGRDGAR